ncbi:hypothetical protein C0J52_02866 [Blattella germanica]|nr:hypothetical protein C0J52_02866 [Blattella germanica]
MLVQLRIRVWRHIKGHCLYCVNLIISNFSCRRTGIPRKKISRYREHKGKFYFFLFFRSRLEIRGSYLMMTFYSSYKSQTYEAKYNKSHNKKEEEE